MLRAADADIATSWRRLPFIMDQETEVQRGLLNRSQSSVRNAKAASETAAYNQLVAELGADQAVYRSQRARAESEGERRRGQLLATLDSYHGRAWDKVAEYMDSVTPVWHLKTKEMHTVLPGKLQPWLHEVVLIECVLIVTCRKSQLRCLWCALLCPTAGGDRP